MKKYKVYILLLSVLIIIAIIWNAINEQNTGPVIRIYAVSLNSEDWKEMEQYGNYMPHTKYGTTRIYFFLNNTDLPEELSFGEINIAEQYRKNCIAIYEKDGMSQTSMRKYPFKN